jgi:hypothetical protein
MRRFSQKRHQIGLFYPIPLNLGAGVPNGIKCAQTHENQGKPPVADKWDGSLSQKTRATIA